MIKVLWGVEICVILHHPLDSCIGLHFMRDSILPVAGGRYCGNLCPILQLALIFLRSYRYCWCCHYRHALDRMGPHSHVEIGVLGAQHGFQRQSLFCLERVLWNSHRQERRWSPWRRTRRRRESYLVEQHEWTEPTCYCHSCQLHGMNYSIFTTIATCINL